MDVISNQQNVMNDHERLFDAWADGGVDGMVIGPLVFNSPDLLKDATPAKKNGSPTITFDPDPAVYRRLGVDPPEAPEPMEDRRKLLEKTFQAAKDRGFSVWIFQAQTGAGPGGDEHHLYDQRSRAATCARMVDTLQQYPMVDGAIMDGPEWGYEIAPHHMNKRSYIFDDLPESVAPLCQELGYDYQALVATKNRLFNAMHNIDGDAVPQKNTSGFPGDLAEMGDQDLLAWFDFRIESLTAYFRGVNDCVKAETSRPVKLGVGPRTASFAPLCGYDFTKLLEFLDVLCPKHYFWHRGFDGLIGTVGRYVETLCLWNRGLSDGAALSYVRGLFGLSLPGVETRIDFENAMFQEFFDEVVVDETKRALGGVDDPERIVPWTDAGRFPHDGDPMSARDLQSILRASESAGLTRFLYHHHGNLTDGEWTVMSKMCGNMWDALSSDYRPPDRLVL